MCNLVEIRCSGGGDCVLVSVYCRGQKARCFLYRKVLFLYRKHRTDQDGDDLSGRMTEETSGGNLEFEE